MRTCILGLAAVALMASAPPARANDVTVEIDNLNDFLPCKIHWIVGDKTGEIETGGKIPAGQTKLIIRPRHSGKWYQWATWCVNNKITTTGPNQIEQKTVKGDVIRVIPLQPAPNWNAATVRIKGEFAMVWVSAEPVGFTNWARKGPAAVSKDLAAAFMKNRKEKGAWGEFKGALGVHLYVPSTGDNVPEGLRDIKEADLTAAIEDALKIIRKQRQPVGPSVEEILKNAASD